MAYTYAGRYSELFYVGGALSPGSSVTVRLAGTAIAASLYTSRAKTAAAANPVTVDASGNLSFYADPGIYDLFHAGTTLAGIQVPVDHVRPAPEGTYAEPGGGGGGAVATDAIWDAAGDLAVGTGPNTAARLAKGTALQVLRTNAAATALEWAAPSGGVAVVPLQRDGWGGILPTGLRLRGLVMTPNLTQNANNPPNGWVEYWGSEYTPADQDVMLDRAVALGCNAVRHMGDFQGFHSGAYTQATYLARFAVFLDKCRARGLLVYVSCIQADHEPVGASNAQLTAYATAFAQMLAGYTDIVVAVDAYHEADLGVAGGVVAGAAWSTRLASITALVDGVRAGCDIPVTVSSFTLGVPALWFQDLDPLVDFHDFHGYSDATVTSCNVMFENTTKAFVVGEFGIQGNDYGDPAGSAARVARYLSVRDFLHDRLECLGSFAFCAQKWDTGVLDFSLFSESTVTNKQLTSNVATLTTAAAHGLVVNQFVTVSGMGAPFDGSWTVASVPSATTFTYARRYPTNVASGAATGRVGGERFDIGNVFRTFSRTMGSWVVKQEVPAGNFDVPATNGYHDVMAALQIRLGRSAKLEGRLKMDTLTPSGTDLYGRIVVLLPEGDTKTGAATAHPGEAGAQKRRPDFGAPLNLNVRHGLVTLTMQVSCLPNPGNGVVWGLQTGETQSNTVATYEFDPE